jgi:hypothetical protein
MKRLFQYSSFTFGIIKKPKSGINMDNSTKFFDDYIGKLFPPYPRSDIPNEWIPLYGPWKNEYRSEVRGRKDIINYYFYNPENDIIYCESSEYSGFAPEIVRSLFWKNHELKDWRYNNLLFFRTENLDENSLYFVNGSELNCEILRFKCKLMGINILHDIITMEPQFSNLDVKKLFFKSNEDKAMFNFYFNDYIKSYERLKMHLPRRNNYF